MSGEYDVGDYGIFSDATQTTKNLNTNIETSKQTIESCKTQLSNDIIFMGPICDSCIEGFEGINTKMSNISSNLGTIENYLIEASKTYQSGDEEANKNILQFSGSKVSVGTSSSSGVQTGKANQDTICNYLSQQGFNDAAICGILANIDKESSFDPNAVGDNGTSYGICQWHNNRWTQLNNYCSQNNLDSSSVEGQVSYLVWELKNNYPSVYNKIKNVPNTAEGAYDAAYEWTVNYEAPTDKYQTGQTRGNVAVSDYWPTYSQ